MIKLRDLRHYLSYQNINSNAIHLATRRQRFYIISYLLTWHSLIITLFILPSLKEKYWNTSYKAFEYLLKTYIDTTLTIHIIDKVDYLVLNHI